ncbi:MAG: peroxiredoxin [Myxococcaceae bacterium]
MINTDDKMPDVTLPGPGGKDVRLQDLLGRKTLVVYFYPKDETAGCTAEACSFRDRYEDFKTAGAEVVGISGDSVSSHEGFAANHRLPFILLSDPEGRARRAFGVKKSFLGLVEGRVTFVIDRSGVVRHVFDSQVLATKHVSEALKVIRGLELGTSGGAR